MEEAMVELVKYDSDQRDKLKKKHQRTIKPARA